MAADADRIRPPRPRAGLRAETVATGLAVAICLIAVLPLLTILYQALSPGPGVWPHLLRTTLPYSVQQTLLLMGGVATVTLVVGAGTAWLVSMYRFPGRNFFDWAMILPLAFPTYITAYCYGDFLDYGGPVQTAVRALGGYSSFHDYWFPQVRSLGGAVFILSAVLYPYVYITARASFTLQSVHVLEVARTLGRTGAGALVSVALPLARPALAAGVSLALMECINDIGAVEYLGVDTLTRSVFDAWIQRSSLAGAAQMALVMFLFVVLLLALERFGRRKIRFQTGRTDRPVSQTALPAGKGWLATLACAAPFAAGFAIPFGILIDGAIAQGAQAGLTDFAYAARKSFLLAFATALIAVLFAFTLAAAMRLTRSRTVATAARVSSLGYAIPGTVIGIGLIVPLAAFDNALSAYFQSNYGFRTGLLLSGTTFALILAYTIRFLAVALGTVEAGWHRVSPNLDAAARTLGASPLRMLISVHLPLLRPAIGAAALLVFVDTMKELPATLLLRPFNFETLATYIYVYASQEQFEKSAIAALTIVAAGLIPLILMHRALTSLQTSGFTSGTGKTQPGNAV